MRYKIPIFLIAIMTTIAITTSGLALWRMYDTALSEAKMNLVMSAQSQAKLFEAMYEEDTKHFRQHGKGEQEAFNHLMLSMKKAHRNYEGYGETGEFVLGRREGGRIVFLLTHRHGGLTRSEPVAWESRLAEPMRRALSGETGTIIAPDYRGVEVLAAYEPLQAHIPLGIVAKIDLAEIRGPFIHTGMIALGVTLLLVLAGSLLFFRVTEPLIRRLAASESRHKTLLAAIPEIVAETDTEKRYIWLNKKGREFFGEEALGREAAEYFVGEQRTYDIVQPLFEGAGETVYVESLQRRRDGEARLLAWYSKALKDQRDNVTGILSTARDITDARKTALLNRVILESAGEGIMGLDSEGNHLFVNPAAARMLGYTPEEMIGRPSHPMWHHTKEDGSPFPEAECPITGVLRNGTVHTRTEDLFWRKDGSAFPSRYISTPITEEVGVSGAVVIFEDITQEIADRNQLERLNRILRMLSLGNQILVRSEDETKLLEAICRLFTDTGLYPVAWIAISAEDPSQHPRPAAASGIDDETLTGLLKETEEGKTVLPLTKALQTQKAQVFNDMTTPDLPGLCRKAGETLGIGSLGAFPFSIDSGRKGALVVCSGKKDAFGEKEIGLLEELAGDLAYGLGTLKTREEREKSRKEALRFRELMDRSTDAVFLIDPESGRFFDVNDRACERLGYSRDELLGMHVFELEGNNPDHAAWQEHINNVEASRRHLPEGAEPEFLLQREHHRKDGSTFPVEVSVRHVTSHDGQKYIVAVARDITERKEAEERFRQLFENISSGMAVYRPVDNGDDFVFVDLNRAGEEISQVKKSDVVGQRLSDIFPGAREMGLTDALKRVSLTGRPERIPTIRYQDDRITMWVENRLYRLNNGELVALYDDMGELRKKEQSEKLFKELVDQSTDAIFVVDKTGRFLNVNQTACKSLGYGRKELLGLGVSDIMGGKETIPLQERIETIRKKGAYVFESYHKTKGEISSPWRYPPDTLQQGRTETS